MVDVQRGDSLVSIDLQPTTLIVLTIVGAVFVLLLVLLAMPKRRMKNGTTRQTYALSRFADPGVKRGRLNLDDVLDEALRIAGGIGQVTVARMSTAVRYSPAEYEVGVRRVLQLYEQGHVISVDLSSLDVEDGIKLVNYCGGVIGISRGAMFRLATRVFMLIPPRE